jgi:hypothetical protein
MSVRDAVICIDQVCRLTRKLLSSGSGIDLKVTSDVLVEYYRELNSFATIEVIDPASVSLTHSILSALYQGRILRISNKSIDRTNDIGAEYARFMGVEYDPEPTLPLTGSTPRSAICKAMLCDGSYSGTCAFVNPPSSEADFESFNELTLGLRASMPLIAVSGMNLQYENTHSEFIHFVNGGFLSVLSAMTLCHCYLGHESWLSHLFYYLKRPTVVIFDDNDDKVYRRWFPNVTYYSNTERIFYQDVAAKLLASFRRKNKSAGD